MSKQNTIDRLPNNTPILVASAAVMQRTDDPVSADDAVALMSRATRDALKHLGASGDALRASIKRVYVPRGTWLDADPARAVAQNLELQDATSVLAEIGILQQTLFTSACMDVMHNPEHAVVVTGADAKYRELQAAIQNIELVPREYSSVPDEVLTPDAEIWAEQESRHGFAMPVTYYSALENALRFAHGQSLADHRHELARLQHECATVAADNPYAWHRTPLDISVLEKASTTNRMLAFPYCKWHNSQWNVDQGASLVFCSVQLAKQLGIPTSEWLFPVAAGESNRMLNLSQRPRLDKCPAWSELKEGVLSRAAMTIDSIDLLDFYSCFPIAMRLQARAFELPIDRAYTVTGGMTFAGGPLNNYVLQSLTRVAELLRAGQGQSALVTSISGMLTKQGMGVWSTEPPSTLFDPIDITERMKVIEPAKTLADGYVGGATVATYTVTHTKGKADRVIAVVDLPDERRQVAHSEDPEINALATQVEFCGHSVVIQEDGTFCLP